MADLDNATLLELGKLALKVAQNQKTRRQFFKAVKEVEPDRYNAQIDQVTADTLDQIKAEREQDKLEREQEKINARLEAARSALTSRYSEDDIKKIETDIMQKLGITDYEAAAKIFAADHAPANPRNDVPRPSATWELPTFEGLAKDPAKAARNMAYQVIDELQRGRR